MTKQKATGSRTRKSPFCDQSVTAKGILVPTPRSVTVWVIAPLFGLTLNTSKLLPKYLSAQNIATPLCSNKHCAPPGRAVNGEPAKGVRSPLVGSIGKPSKAAGEPLASTSIV